MDLRHPKRLKTVPPKFTAIRLHAADCTESAQDLQRMRDLIKEDPSLLYSVQPNPPANQEFHYPGGLRMWIAPLEPDVNCPPLWQACEAQHLACVNFILQASGPENLKLLEKFSCDIPRKENVLSYSLFYGKDSEKSCEIIKSLLQHGISPNVEIPISEISNPELVKVLVDYKATKLIFPSCILQLVVEGGYSKILELLFDHGAYPDPVILTESGSVLPLYPTLGKHLNQIPEIQQSGFEDSVLFSIFNRYLHIHVAFKQTVAIKTLFVHGASVTPYSLRRQNNKGLQIFSQVLFPFDVINKLGNGFTVTWVRDVADVNSIYGVKPDGTMFRHYDIILEILKLYHLFGGSLWWKMKSRNTPCEGGKGECVEWLRDPGRVTPCKTVIDVLRDDIRDPDVQSMLVEEVERMMSTPPSLQHSARLAIRRCMGYGCVRNLEALPLPDPLKKYLKFEDE